jgi:hypothetical protein
MSELTDWLKSNLGTPTDEISAQAVPVTSDPKAPIDITPQLYGVAQGSIGPLAPHVSSWVNGTIDTARGTGKPGNDLMQNIVDKYNEYKTALQQAHEQHPAEFNAAAAAPEAALLGGGIKGVLGKLLSDDTSASTQAGSGTPEVPKTAAEQLGETPLDMYIKDWKAKRLVEDYMNAGLPTRPMNEGASFDPTVHMSEDQIAANVNAFKNKPVTPSTDSPVPSPLTPQMQASWDAIKQAHNIQSYADVVAAAKRHFPNEVADQIMAAKIDALKERLINGTPQPNPTPIQPPTRTSLKAEWIP